MPTSNRCRPFARGRGHPSLAAFTLVEVMIAVAVLTIGMFGVLSMIPTLSKARESAVEMVIARQLAATIAERIQGTAWKDLGGTTTQIGGAVNINAWSLPRYRDKTVPVNPPLTETDPDPNNNLIACAILSQRAGVPDLKVYVEYYDAARAGLRDAPDRKSWYDALIVANRWPISNKIADFSDTLAQATLGTPTTVVRIIVTWREQNGSPQNSHEIFISRKE